MIRRSSRDFTPIETEFVRRAWIIQDMARRFDSSISDALFITDLFDAWSPRFAKNSTRAPFPEAEPAGKIKA